MVALRGLLRTSGSWCWAPAGTSYCARFKSTQGSWLFCVGCCRTGRGVRRTPTLSTSNSRPQNWTRSTPESDKWRRSAAARAVSPVAGTDRHTSMYGDRRYCRRPALEVHMLPHAPPSAPQSVRRSTASAAQLPFTSVGPLLPGPPADQHHRTGRPTHQLLGDRSNANAPGLLTVMRAQHEQGRPVQ